MELFGISMEKGLVILVLGLIIVGPQKMVEFARTAGRMLGEFKMQTDALRQMLTVEGAIPPPAAPPTSVSYIPAAAMQDERVLALQAYARPRPADSAPPAASESALDEERAS